MNQNDSHYGLQTVGEGGIFNKLARDVGVETWRREREKRKTERDLRGRQRRQRGQRSEMFAKEGDEVQSLTIYTHQERED